MINHRRPPETALKKIGGGRLKGFSNINPQWRIDTMNEKYGMCGNGWVWEIVKLWTEECPEGERICHAQVQVKVKDGCWIPGVGGNKIIAKESNALHVSDEGYKMAVTDALSTALKFLGIGGDVYLDLWDDKYSTWKAPAKVDDEQIRNEIGSLCENIDGIEGWTTAKAEARKAGLLNETGVAHMRKLYNEWEESESRTKSEIEEPFEQMTGGYK